MINNYSRLITQGIILMSAASFEPSVPTVTIPPSSNSQPQDFDKLLGLGTTSATLGGGDVISNGEKSISGQP